MTRSLASHERALAWVTDTVARQLLGTTATGLSEELIATMGPRRYLRFMLAFSRVMTQLNVAFGERYAQYIVGMAGLWNGCGLCGYGHIFNAALLHYRQTGELHPLHPWSAATLFDLEDREAIKHLAELLRAPRHTELRELGLRLHALKFGCRPPTTPQDHLLQRTLRIWDWMAECTVPLGIHLQPDTAFPHSHPVTRDRALLARYQAARRRQAAGADAT